MTGYAHIYVHYYCYYIVIQAAAIFTCSGRGQTALASSSLSPSTEKKKKKTQTKSRRSLPPKVVVFYCYRSGSRPVVLSGDKQNRAGGRAGYSRARTTRSTSQGEKIQFRQPTVTGTVRANKITFLGNGVMRAIWLFIKSRKVYTHIYSQYVWETNGLMCKRSNDPNAPIHDRLWTIRISRNLRRKR